MIFFPRNSKIILANNNSAQDGQDVLVSCPKTNLKAVVVLPAATKQILDAECCHHGVQCRRVHDHTGAAVVLVSVQQKGLRDGVKFGAADKVVAAMGNLIGRDVLEEQQVAAATVRIRWPYCRKTRLRGLMQWCARE